MVPIAHGSGKSICAAICNQVARTCRTAACLVAACPNLVSRHEQFYSRTFAQRRRPPSFNKVRNPTIFDPRPAVAFTTLIARSVKTLNGQATSGIKRLPSNPELSEAQWYGFFMSAMNFFAAKSNHCPSACIGRWPCAADGCATPVLFLRSACRISWK